MHRTTTAALAVLAVLVAAGCGESKQDKAMANVCSARDDISKQVDQLTSLTLGTATTSKVTDSLQAIRDDLGKIGDARGDLADDRRAEVSAANDQFAASVRKTLGELGTTASLQDASSQLKTAFTDLESSYSNTFGKLDCD
jgi:uncharacterized protein YjbJ (UPF0337 family)